MWTSAQAAVEARNVANQAFTQEQQKTFDNNDMGSVMGTPAKAYSSAYIMMKVKNAELRSSSG
jgi:hypothetical protein